MAHVGKEFPCLKINNKGGGGTQPNHMAPMQNLGQSIRNRTSHTKERASHKIDSRKQLKILFLNKLYLQGNQRKHRLNEIGIDKATERDEKLVSQSYDNK